MMTLSALPDFLDADAAGLFRIAATDAPMIAQVAVACGCRVCRIDLAGCEDKTGLLARIAAALDFPDWFGHNWDALADCLDDLEWLPADAYVILFENVTEAAPTLSVDLATALSIFADAADDWALLGVPMWVFGDFAPPPPPSPRLP